MQNNTHLSLNETGHSSYNGDIKSLVTIISIVTSSFSLLGCSFVLIMFLAFQKLQKFHFKLVFYLCLSILINTIGNLIVINDKSYTINQNYCIMQSFFINFGGLSTVIWNIIICYYIKNLVKSNLGYHINDSLCLSLGYGIPFLMSFMLLFL